MNTTLGTIECDVAIVGGGMVGLSLAAALRVLPLSVVVVEPVAADDTGQPSFDARNTALSNGSRRILEGLGVWPAVAADATPIRRIHVSERGRFGFARLSAEEHAVPALGYTLENRVLGAALSRVLAGAPRVRLLCPARVEALTAGESRVGLQVAGTCAAAVSARLVVAADGARSEVRSAFGIDATVWDYGQQAVIANVATEKFHEFVAYERFTSDGPLAVLPLGDGRCTIVWTLTPPAAAAALELDDAAFLAALQQRFGYRLGRFTRVGTRHSYPLALTRSGRQVAPRAVIIGNAAQGLHPIAGQGFNLGLRDVATLAEVLADEVRERGPAADPGAAAVLERYVAWRRGDRRSVIAFTDGLVRLFGSPLPGIGAARSAGLLLFDLLPPAKGAFARLSMGLSGRVPRLGRGLPVA